MCPEDPGGAVPTRTRAASETEPVQLLLNETPEWQHGKRTMSAMESRQDWKTSFNKKCGNCNVHIKVFFYYLKKDSTIWKFDNKLSKLARVSLSMYLPKTTCYVFNTLLACSIGKSVRVPSLFDFHQFVIKRWIAENPAVLKKKIPDSKYATWTRQENYRDPKVL